MGSFLDWSLDYCSGYEGDQESEGEKEGDGESRSHRAAQGLWQTGQWAEGGLSSRAPGLTCRKTCPDTGRRERTAARTLQVGVRREDLGQMFIQLACVDERTSSEHGERKRPCLEFIIRSFQDIV